MHEITVVDEGVGMSSKDAKNVFTPFFRSESRENRELNTGGHGLGLSICMKIAKQMKGTIKVDSKLGTGSCFKFVFKSPLAEVVRYNMQSSPKVLLHRRVERLRRKIGLKMSKDHAPKMELIDEESSQDPESSE